MTLSGLSWQPQQQQHLWTYVEIAVEAEQSELMLEMNAVVDVFNGMYNDVDELHTRYLWQQQMRRRWNSQMNAAKQHDNTNKHTW